MPYQRSKSCPPDPLQTTHDIYKSKLDDYREVRPAFKYISFRHKRHVFLKDQKHHENVTKAVGFRIRSTSKAALKIAGTHALHHITDTIVDHGKKVRNKTVCINALQHQFRQIKEKADLHPDSLYKRKANHQKYFMQVIAADLEAQSLIQYLETVQLEEGIIDEVIPKEHALYQFHPLSEKYLDNLRMIFLG